MKRVILLYCGLLLCTAWFGGLCHGESLSVLERHRLDKYYEVISGLRTGGDTLLFTSRAGLYLRMDTTLPWQKLADSYPPGEQVPFSVCRGHRLSRLIMPSGLWLLSEKGAPQILIYENFCGSLCSLAATSDSAVCLVQLQKAEGGDRFETMNMQNGVILSGLWVRPGKETVAIKRLVNGDYHRVFPYPPALAKWRDSIGLSHTPFCIPAISPHDSTLWIAIEGYNFLYVTNIEGKLLDSVPISLPDFRMPPRLKSRMKSAAVYDDWSSQWTYTTSFSYAPPGYFIMQYKIGNETCSTQTLNKYATIVWNIYKQVIPLTIDPLWRVAGVQDDGRIIFVAAEADSSGCKETIIVTRIEP